MNPKPDRYKLSSFIISVFVILATFSSSGSLKAENRLWISPDLGFSIWSPDDLRRTKDRLQSTTIIGGFRPLRDTTGNFGLRVGFGDFDGVLESSVFEGGLSGSSMKSGYEYEDLYASVATLLSGAFPITFVYQDFRDYSRRDYFLQWRWSPFAIESFRGDRKVGAFGIILGLRGNNTTVKDAGSNGFTSFQYEEKFRAVGPELGLQIQAKPEDYLVISFRLSGFYGRGNYNLFGIEGQFFNQNSLLGTQSYPVAFYLDSDESARTVRSGWRLHMDTRFAILENLWISGGLVIEDARVSVKNPQHTAQIFTALPGVDLTAANAEILVLNRITREQTYSKQFRDSAINMNLAVSLVL